MTTENMVQRRDVLRTAAGAGLGLLGAGSVWAQASAWPTKPVNLVVPLGAPMPLRAPWLRSSPKPPVKRW